LPEGRVIEILDNMDEEEVVRKTLEKHVNGTRTEALLNVETGEVEYHTLVGNSDLQQRGHLIDLFHVEGNAEEGLSVEDFLSEEEIEAFEEDADFWTIIRELPDYQERLIDAWLHYFEGFFDVPIREKLSEIYQEEPDSEIYA
jgi:hypothetical protein